MRMIDLDSTVDSAKDILDLCVQYQSKLDFNLEEMPNWALLYTIAGVESSFGSNNVCRFEEAYSRRGKFFKARHLQRAHEMYGDLAAMSYGPWQIMYIKAYELGFQGNPLELWFGRVSIEYVVRYLNESHSRGAKRVFEFLDAYNSGSHRDGFVPHSYIEKFDRLYLEQTKKIKIQEGEINGV